MNTTNISQAYLNDLELTQDSLDINFVNQLQSKHIAKHSFNSLAVVLGQELPLDSDNLLDKIVNKRLGGYCFEHNKLVFNVLEALGFEVRLLLNKVVYNRDVDVARTHRATLLTYQGDDYIVDAGFGHLGARYPVKLALDVEQDQGDATYRITEKTNALGEAIYHYQIFKAGDFFTLYTFDLQTYTEADCLPAHFYSHKHPEAAFVNNLVVSRKQFNQIQSLRNAEYHHIENGQTQVSPIDSASYMHELLTQVFELNIDPAISEFLFYKFAKPQVNAQAVNS